MSNYGFTTYNPETDRIVGMVNSKYPIFGPRYDQIKKFFHTVHVTDTHVESLHTASLSVPSTSAGRTGISQYHEKNKTLVATIPHNLGKRPLGYVTLSGTLVQNVHANWVYTRQADTTGTWAGSTSIPETPNTQSCSIIRGMGESTTRFVPDSYPGILFFQNTSSAVNPSSINCSPWVKNVANMIPGTGSTPDYEGIIPYDIAVDDNNVYLYRNTAWCDVLRRDYYYYSSSSNWDLRSRTKGSVDFAGSSFDLTIYLCPYTMEELLS